MNNKVSNNVGSLPQHFVSFVEILFGVVLGSSILIFRDILFSLNLKNPSFWALISVYITAATSWVGWHKSNTKYPYTDSGSGYFRSVLDALIVATYAGLLFFASRISQSFSNEKLDNALLFYLWSYFFVFFLYYLSGLVRKAEYGSSASRSKIIIIHGLIVLVAAVAYLIISPDLIRNHNSYLWVFLLLPLFVMLSFRWLREWRELPWIINRRMIVAIDLDGVIVEQVVPTLQKIKRELNIELDKSDITDWEYKIGNTNIKDEIEKAERDEQFVSQMPVIEGTTNATALISKKYNLVIATSRESITDVWSRNWLKEHGIVYTGFINTRETGKTLSGIDILIDDYVGNIDKFIRSGNGNRQAILFSQPWNSDVDKIAEFIKNGRVKIAHSWSAVLAILGSNDNEYTGKETNVKIEDKNKTIIEKELPRDYLALEAFSSFIASFILLRGYTINYNQTDTFSVITHHSIIPLSLVFLALSFFFFIAAYTGRLYAIGKRTKQILLPSSGIISLAVIITTWVDGIKMLVPGSILFNLFFSFGFVFFLLYSAHFLWSTCKYSEIYKPKPKEETKQGGMSKKNGLDKFR